MLSTTLLAFLILGVEQIKSEGIASPAGGGISKSHRQQDDHGNYNFGYEIQDPTSHQFRKETGDAYGRIVGSYGLSEADGRHRIVDYVADEYGFRAKVRTNEPGTKSENSASVEVHKPGHPPGPPRIPNLVAAPPVVALPSPPIAALPPPPHPPPPPPHSPSVYSPPIIASPQPSTGKSHVPLSVQSGIPYISHPPVSYRYPYYYSPPPISYGNSIYSLPQSKQPVYINPQPYRNTADDYTNYKPVINPQTYFPIPPPITKDSQKYPPPYYSPPLHQFQTDLNLQTHDGNRIVYAGSNLPANYKVIPIPNGIQAVPIDSQPAVNVGGGVFSSIRPPNYPHDDRNYPRDYPSNRDIDYVDTRQRKSEYSYAPRDYHYSGSRQAKSTIPEERKKIYT